MVVIGDTFIYHHALKERAATSGSGKCLPVLFALGLVFQAA